MKKVKSFKEVVLVQIKAVLLGLVFLTPQMSLADDAETLQQSEWFQSKCQPSVDRFVEERMVVESATVEDAWNSPMTDQLPWPTAFRSQYARHACVQLEVKYLNQTALASERVLCSVLDNDLPTEVKIFGNEELAAEICAEPG